ncbi:IS3 family transposase [Paenibacillus taiwanensis]|uniref:IS3 family transposase n=1 Tax=Paenibacillus taiwanensis TaxID=401638 RepID=UPI0012FC2902|nr:IS3 family transposase [Paenibacillus taiwanensis]
MAKYSYGDKLEAVLEYLKGKKSYRTIADERNMSSAPIKRWVARFKEHGVAGLISTYTNHDVQFKMDVLYYMKEHGASVNETATRFNLSTDATILRWIKQYEAGGMSALISKKKGRPSVKKETSVNKQTKKRVLVDGSLEALQEEVKRLRMENSYFKKVEYLSSKQGKVTKQDKAKVIFELRTEFPINALLQLAKLPRSTYYYWLKILERPDKDTAIKALIAAVYHEHKGRYSYRRITLELRNQGHSVNHKRVQRIMAELGLKSIVRMKKYRSYKGHLGKVAPNIIERDFQATKPNEKWVTDITEFKLFGEKLYLSPILDLYNGEIITYTIDSRPVYTLVSTMLEQAFKRLHNEDTLLIHSDQGWHYQMAQYRDALQERGITQSMSRKGNCYDNAVMESFFGILKSEFLYIEEFESIEQFKEELVAYIKYYNHKRIKVKLKGMSPVQYRTHALDAA